MHIILSLFLSIFFLSPPKDPPVKKNKVELVPYGEVYANSMPFDTLCPNGIYLQNLVNRDTADHNLYLAYGNTHLRKIHCVEDGLDLKLCARPRFAYATDRTIALFSNCNDFHGILLISLFPDHSEVKKYSPVYINLIDSLLLLQDYETGKDKFFLTNMDNDKDKHQEIYLAAMFDNVINPKQKAFATNTVTDCFDTISYEKSMLTVVYLIRTLENDKPENNTKKFRVKWK